MPKPCTQRSLDIFRAHSDVYGEAEALNNLGLIALYQGQRDAAQRYCDEGLGLFRKIGDRRGTAAALKNLAAVARARRDWDLARDFYGQSLAVYEWLGDRRNINPCREGLIDLSLALAAEQPLDASTGVNHARAEPGGAQAATAEGEQHGPN